MIAPPMSDFTLDYTTETVSGKMNWLDGLPSSQYQVVYTLAELFNLGFTFSGYLLAAEVSAPGVSSLIGQRLQSPLLSHHQIIHLHVMGAFRSPVSAWGKLGTGKVGAFIAKFDVFILSAAKGIAS